jgi:hypothetical protein
MHVIFLCICMIYLGCAVNDYTVMMDECFLNLSLKLHFSMCKLMFYCV